MSKYIVELTASADVETTVEVESASYEEAVNKALEMDVVWEYKGVQDGTVEVESCLTSVSETPTVQLSGYEFPQDAVKTLEAEGARDSVAAILASVRENGVSVVELDDTPWAFAIRTFFGSPAMEYFTVYHDGAPGIMEVCDSQILNAYKLVIISNDLKPVEWLSAANEID